MSKSDLAFKASELAPLFNDIKNNLSSDERTEYSKELLMLTALIRDSEIRCHLRNLVFLLKLINYVTEPLLVTGEVIKMTKEFVPHLKKYVKEISKENKEKFPVSMSSKLKKHE